ncbi:acyltransferase [Ferrimonas marina]|uniref:1-acyl-sn-glycerol-3-phosphate acyltransferase n=1 Tax=Ferrimonas marina TaxID=299255 RepID=A0A1M5XTG3_9GAMM|nr:acyltransferase [Ferrimonas marina]SHI03115.1 1-acyl-sn-glycerol-3-phosphate acyltransferase [Ferrimonas marina]
MLSTLRGVLSFLGYLFNTLFWAPWVVLLGLLKLLPIQPLRRVCSGILDRMATAWISINNLNQRLLSGTKVIAHKLPELSPKQWYLVVANHQSWVDILMLQRLFNHKIPFLKFFLKWELIYVPVLGLAWWALDFPFMRRYSKSFLAKYPHLKGKDQETTRKACEKFHHQPVSVMNFVEGTRFTPIKQQKQNSPYPSLLKPKVGGVALSLDAMNGKLQRLLDVTIYYPNGVPSFWDFLCGRVPKVEMVVEERCLKDLNGLNYEKREDKAAYQSWLNQIWQQKAGKLADLEHQRNTAQD